MAKFYLQDIPKAPGAGPGPQGAEVPVGPYRRSGAPAQYGEINAQVQNINIAKNIPSLMQKELPGNLSNALVGGRLAVGEAWAGAAEALSNLAETTGKIMAQMQYSKDIADKSRVKNLMHSFDAAFKERAANEQLTSLQQLELAPSYHAKLKEDIAKMGLSPENAMQADADLELFRSRHVTDLTYAARDEQRKSNLDAIDTRIRQAAASGDIEGAVDAIEDARQAGLITPEERDKRILDTKIVFDEYKAQTDIGTNPRAALVDLEDDLRTGISSSYPNLTPGQIKELRNQAKSEVTRQETAAKESILNGIADGTLKTRKDVENVAEGDLGAHEVDILVNHLEAAGPDYNPETYSKIETAIEGYVKEPLESGAPRYHEILGMIMTGAPKKEHSDLIDRLQKKRDAKKESLPGKDWFPELLNEFTNMTEDGRFIPKVERWAMDPRGPGPAFTIDNMKDPKWRLEHKAELDAMWDRTRSMQVLMRKWRQEHPGDDEQTIKDARAYQNQLLELDSSGAGREAIQKELYPQLPFDYGGTRQPTSSLGPPIQPGAISQRQEIMAELDDPRTKKLAMQMMDTEGGGAATVEALVNRVAMIRQRIPDWGIWDELNSGFYGPINRGHAQTLKLHPDTIAQYDREIEKVRAGSNIIRGRTDQGYPGDPNWQGPGRVRVASNPREVYNYWTGKRRGIHFSHEDSARFAQSYG